LWISGWGIATKEPKDQFHMRQINQSGDVIDYFSSPVANGKADIYYGPLG
jgi:hypothetical protein